MSKQVMSTVNLCPECPRNPRRAKVAGPCDARRTRGEKGRRPVDTLRQRHRPIKTHARPARPPHRLPHHRPELANGAEVG